MPNLLAPSESFDFAQTLGVTLHYRIAKVELQFKHPLFQKLQLENMHLEQSKICDWNYVDLGSQVLFLGWVTPVDWPWTTPDSDCGHRRWNII